MVIDCSGLFGIRVSKDSSLYHVLYDVGSMKLSLLYVIRLPTFETSKTSVIAMYEVDET